MLELKLKYRRQQYKIAIPDADDGPLYAEAVSNEVSNRLNAIENSADTVNTQEIAIMAGLLAEYEYSKARDSYRKLIDDANSRLSELNLLLDSVLK